MEAHSLGVGDSFDEVVEELTPVTLTPVIGMLPLAPQDSEELGSGLKEPAPLADALEGAGEESGPCAVTIGEQASMVADRLGCA
jgi:hypothetical protein